MKRIAGVWTPLICTLLLAPIARAADDSGISLHISNATAQVAFEKLFREISFKTKVDPTLWEKYTFNPVTMDVSGGRFWDLMTQLNRSTGICMGRVNGDEVELWMDHGASSRRPFVVVGPLMVGAVSTESEYAVELTKTHLSSESCRVNLEIVSDPRYQAALLELVKSEPAQNPAPNRPGADRPTRQPTPQFVSFAAGRTSLQIDVPASDSEKTATDVSGSYLLWRVARANSIAITLTGGANQAEKDFGDFRGALQFARSPNGYSATITLTNERLDPKQWQRLGTVLFTTFPVLTDESGAQYASGGGSGNRNGGGITWKVNFSTAGPDRPPGEPHKLLWKIPVTIESEPITIELKNLQLP